jgi:hypothetical protein
MTTVQELIDLLQGIQDKSQEINVWNRYGYWGSDLGIVIAKDQDDKPLIIENGEFR